MQILSKRIIIIGVLILILCLGIFLFIIELFKNTSTPSTNTQKSVILPPVVTSLPITKQGNTDTNAPKTKQVINEVAKLYPYLPYKNKVTLSTGITVDIVIPAKDFQYTPWTLAVEIYGIDFSVPPNSSNYSVMKNSFREAVSDIFSWERSHGVDPSKIAYIWGRTGNDELTAESWLAYQ